MAFRITPASCGQPTAKLSRRACLPLVAAAVLSPVALVRAQAQADVWQIYRREDLGYEIEMPGTPKIREDGDTDWRSIDAQVDFEDKLFGITWQEASYSISVQEVSTAQRIVAKSLGGKVTRATPITMNGFPGLEIGIESDVLSHIMRVIIIGNRTVAATVVGDRGVHETASVLRFLKSFRLLFAAR